MQLLAGDLTGADRSLGFAREEIPESAEMASWVELDLCRVEGMVRLRQGRGDLAAAALDRAVELGRELPLDDQGRAHSVFERLELATFQGEAQTGIELCRELALLIEDGAAGTERIHQWLGFVAYHTGKAHAACGRDDLTEDCWTRAAGAGSGYRESMRMLIAATDPDLRQYLRSCLESMPPGPRSPRQPTAAPRCGRSRNDPSTW